MILGIDEVGRGAWAGPLVAGAVVLNTEIPGLRDSKQLTKSQREALAQIIRQKAHAIGLGWVSAEEIDEIGLTLAVSLAMQRAIAQIFANYEEIIIDGNYNFLSKQLCESCERLNLSQQRTDSKNVIGSTSHKAEEVKIKAVVGADKTFEAVSAASIVAKVARDKFMTSESEKFPSYGFEKHVGYGTKQHHTQLGIQGITKLHRKSFKPIAALVV
jgi:ribonuclease HII